MTPLVAGRASSGLRWDRIGSVSAPCATRTARKAGWDVHWGFAMLALLLGAGFSKWAAGLPVASELLDLQIEPFGVRDETKLRLVEQMRDAWCAEHPDAPIEQFIAHILQSSGERGKKAALWYIVRRLSEPYIWTEWHAGRWRRHVLMIDENRKLERAGVKTAQQFLLRILGARTSGIVTTNHDLLVEYALGTKRFNYGHQGEQLIGRGPYPVSQWQSPVTLKGTIPLAKVHGSISWDAAGRYTDGRRGLTGNALIVAPTPEKVPPMELATEWQLSRRILTTASRLLVFGFAFNPYDEALLDHLCTNGKSIEQVALVDICPRLDRAVNVWPQAEVHAIGPPPDGNEELRRWIGAGG